MREFVTIAKLKGEPGEPEKRELLAGPEVPYHIQRQNFKKLKVSGKSDKFASAALCELTEIGRVRFNRVVNQAAKTPKAKARTPRATGKNQAAKTPEAQPSQSTESKNENA